MGPDAGTTHHPPAPRRGGEPVPGATAASSAVQDLAGAPGLPEILELLRRLCRRPRFGESPRGGPGGSGTPAARAGRRTGGAGHGRPFGLPVVYLVRPAGMRVLPTLGGYLSLAQPARVPHAYHLLGPVPDGQPGPVPDGDDLEPVRAALAGLAGQFGAGRNARYGRIRFERFELVDWLLNQSLVPADEDPERALLVRLAARAGNVAESLWFRLIVSGRLPVLGARYRWLLNQPYLSPRDPGTFLGFAERLTTPARTAEDTEQILKLLVNAFLADLRAAYRRWSWRGRGAARTVYAVALVDDVERGNGGYRLLRLVGEVRDETGAFDPLLLVAAGSASPPDGLTAGADGERAWPPEQALAAYREWSEGLAARGAPGTGWCLPFQITAPPRQRLGRPGPLTVERPPWWSRRVSIMGLAAALALALAVPGVLVERSFRLAHCGEHRFSSGVGSLWTAEATKETTAGRVGSCVGISDGTFHFGTGRRLAAVQRRILHQNRVAAATCLETGRRCVTLAYLADLDSGAAVAGREGLVGAAALQERQLRPGDGPVLRVVVANAGRRMGDGPRVARRLGQLAKRDRGLIGVIGLDQSRPSAARTMDVLADEGLPLVAATPAAASAVVTSPAYFQVPPPVARQAAVVARYVRYGLEAEYPSLAADRRVRIVGVDDGYGRAVADAVAAGLADPAVGYRVDRASDVDAPGPYRAGQQSCSYPGVVFFAGRAEAFREFLDGVTDSCRNIGRPQPVILAGDDAARLVGDGDERGRHPGVRFDYVSFAVGHDPCSVRDDLYRTLRAIATSACDAGAGADPGTAGDDRDDAPSEEYAMLSYDAGAMMLVAVRAAGARVPNPALVLDRLADVSGPGALDGYTGLVDLDRPSGGRFPVGKALGVVRVDEPRPVGDRGVPGGAVVGLRGLCGTIRGLAPSPWCPPELPADRSAARSAGGG